MASHGKTSLGGARPQAHVAQPSVGPRSPPNVLAGYSSRSQPGMSGEGVPLLMTQSWWAARVAPMWSW